VSAIISLSPFIGFVQFPTAIKRMFMWIGSYWMAIFVYMFLVLLVTDIMFLVGRILKLVPDPAMFRFCAAASAVVITLLAITYGRANATFLHHTSYEIKTKTESFPEGLNIVLVSDLHLGALNSETMLQRMAEEINKLSPDIVCIAGDIFNNDVNAIRDPGRAIELFKRINATHGVFASLGNHDGGSTFNEMLSFLAQGNITVLKDEHAVIDNRLALVGRLDPSPIRGFGGLRRKSAADVLAQTEAGLPVIVMDHNPANIGEYGSGVELVLSGHTHRGQIFPGNVITKAIFPVHYGHFQKDNDSPHIVVTSGISTWGMPLRIGSNNEIVSITLR